MLSKKQQDLLKTPETPVEIIFKAVHKSFAESATQKTSSKQSSPATVISTSSGASAQEFMDIQEKLGSKANDESKNIEAIVEIDKEQKNDRDTDNANESTLLTLQIISEASAFELLEKNTDRIAYLRSKISLKQDRLQIKNSTSIVNKSLAPSSKNYKNSPVADTFNDTQKSLPTSCSKLKSSSTKVQGKRERIESFQAPLQDKELTKRSTENVLQCSHCKKCFKTGQALGGHMSRKHSGKSSKYNHKKCIRERREIERLKLHIAKKKYFESLGYNYEEMITTLEGKAKARSLINRSKIKKIKSRLTEKEVSDYPRS